MNTAGYRTRITFAAAAAALPLIFLTGCGDSGAGSIASQAAQYQIPTDEPGKPFPQATEAIYVTNRMGFTVSLNTVTDLDVNETNEVLKGHQRFKGHQWVKSEALRVEDFAEPPATNIVQVNVSLDGPLPLKSIRHTVKGQFSPGPVLGDDIGNFYWPIGYVYENNSGEEYTEVMLDPANPMRDLRDMPTLSQSRPAQMKLVYRVNKGVTLTSYSYGGKEKLTFQLPVVSDR